MLGRLLHLEVAGQKTGLVHDAAYSLAERTFRRRRCGIHQTFPLHRAFIVRPERALGHPLNLSILVSGGMETEKDSLSNGERTGKGSYQKAISTGSCSVVYRPGASGCSDISPLEVGVVEGDIPVPYL